MCLVLQQGLEGYTHENEACFLSQASGEDISREGGGGGHVSGHLWQTLGIRSISGQG